MATSLIAAPKVLLDDRLVDRGWVRLDGQHVVASGGGEPPGTPDMSLPRGVLAPGLVDIQINGAYGYDFAVAGRDGWLEVARRLPETGVTAFVPTIITATIDDQVGSIARYRDLRPEIDAGRGAQTIGMHVEGPFLAPARCGAHRQELMVDPTPDRIAALLAAADGDVVYVTLAPERVGAIDAIRRLVSAGVRVAVGHSDAGDAEVGHAVEAGATLVTHLYNAQSPLHHRDPGVVGAALADPQLTVGLIVDLHHVAPTAVRVAFAAASGRVALVTDAISALGMPPGTYDLGGELTTVLEDQPPLREDGTIAGSVLRLDEAVANAIGCGIDPATVLTAASRVPADAMGRGDLGRLTPGARADLVWFDDDWHATATWGGGRLLHADSERLTESPVPGLELA